MNGFLSHIHPAAKHMQDQLDAELQAALDANPEWLVGDAPYHFEYEEQKSVTIYHYGGRPVLSVGPIQCETKDEDGTVTFTFMREVKRLWQKEAKS